MKKLLKSILFLTILFFLLAYVTSILWLPKNSISYFYEEPKNTEDVIYIGSSNVYTGYNAPLIFEKYGFATGMLTTPSQPFSAVKYMIKESLSYQKPKLYVIDLTQAVRTYDKFDENGVRQSVDTMKFGKNRKDAIDTLLKYRKTPKEEYINYYYSFLMYHNSWSSLSEYHYTGDTTYYKGYVFDKLRTDVVPCVKYEWEDDKMDLVEENREVFFDLIDYIKENKLNVLFVIQPKVYNTSADENSNQMLNTIVDVLNKEDIDVINFNKLDDFSLDFSKDFYNIHHFNVYGATKFSLYFGKYLKENYDLDDHRADPKYASWHKEYKRLEADYQELTGKEFKDLVKEYEKDYN